jgi:hypothetical protein
MRGRDMRVVLVCAAILATNAATVLAQSDPNPAMNDPDQLAWSLFLTVNADAKQLETTTLFSRPGQATLIRSERIQYGQPLRLLLPSGRAHLA